VTIAAVYGPFSQLYCVDSQKRSMKLKISLLFNEQRAIEMIIVVNLSL